MHITYLGLSLVVCAAGVPLEEDEDDDEDEEGGGASAIKYSIVPCLYKFALVINTLNIINTSSTRHHHHHNYYVIHIVNEKKKTYVILNLLKGESLSSKSETPDASIDRSISSSVIVALPPPSLCIISTTYH